MVQSTQWEFYGRHLELEQMERILARGRWFFLQISGRRRIGKTALIQQALSSSGYEKTLYIQIPDSDSVGVVAALPGRNTGQCHPGRHPPRQHHPDRAGRSDHARRHGVHTLRVCGGGSQPSD